MALQTSGQISLNDIQDEFGGTNPIEIDEYYRGGGLVPDISANSNVPTSGQINISDFYGAVNGIPIQVTMVGGGGGGGAGYDDNGQNTPPDGSPGGASFIDDDQGNRIVTANGGAGGASGGFASGSAGEQGAVSPLSGGGQGTGGQAVIQPTYGGDATFGTNVQNSGMGAGGGGGGGDTGFKGNALGWAGNGGSAGAFINNQTYIMSGIVYCTVGEGGQGAPDPGNSVDRRGGRGGPGYINLSGGLSGNFTIGGINSNGSGNGYEQNGPIAYIVTSNAFFLNITSNVQELDVRTTCVNNGWDQNQLVIVTVAEDVFCWSDSTSRGGIRIIGNFPNNININLNGYAMGRGGDGGNAPSGAGGAGGPAIEIDSSAGVNITLGTHGYILGGGGGGGAGVGAGSGCGGGGGAGGGRGGNGSGNAGGTGGGPGVASINSVGASGSGARPGPGGTGGGGGGGYEWGARQGGAGGGGGRRPPSYSGGNLIRTNVRNNCANPGWNGVNNCYPCAFGKGDLTPGQNGTDGGMAGGGGDFGMVGGSGWGNGDTTTQTVQHFGGSAGKAVSRTGGGSVSVSPLTRVYGGID